MALSDDQRPELLRGVAHADYHRDNLPGAPHFSRGVAVRILHQSPLHVYRAHPLLGGQSDDEPSEVMDKGALVHSLILGSGPEIVPVDAGDWRTKAAQEAREEAREAGKLPVLVQHLEECTLAAATISNRLLDLEVVAGDPLDSEVTALWWEGSGLELDRQPNGRSVLPPPVSCKARLDLYPGGNWIGDLKVQRNLNVGSFEWSVKRFGLDIQAHAYGAAVVAKYPELAGRMTFEWLLVERKPPYDVAIIPASNSILALGESRWKRALKTWRECLASGKWPGTGRLPAIEARSFDLEAENLVGMMASEMAFDSAELAETALLARRQKGTPDV